LLKLKISFENTVKKLVFRFLQSACIVLMPFIAQNVSACECDSMTTPYGAYEQSAYVFTGKVVSVKDESGKDINENETANKPWLDGERFYDFEVQELFKGAKSSKINVSYSTNMCQPGFEKEDTYLIYAVKQKDGALTTFSYCWRTGHIADAQDDVYFLRELLAKKPEPRIYGALHLYDKDRKPPYIYLQGIRIIARTGKKTFETFTDKNGLYRFNNLPDGSYRVYPSLSSEYVSEWHYTYEEIILGKTAEYPGSFFSKYIGKNAYSEFQVRRRQP
jgi:hypothetical protein